MSLTASWESGDSYCMLPYEIRSVPIDDLSDWTSKGINHRAGQDPLVAKENAYMYAPDCVKGNDGRYYLYYCLSGYKGNGGYNGPIGVAVCDTPDENTSFTDTLKMRTERCSNDLFRSIPP